MNMETAADSPLFGLAYAVTAYVVIFTALFGYLALLHVAQRRLRKRLERLERQVGKGPA